MTTSPDIHETGDYGYDPDIQEDVPIVKPPRPLTLPPSATVNTAWLPPVGAQGQTPSCFAWGSTYGLATFAAAQAGNYTPSTPDLQASAPYTFIEVMLQREEPAGTCVGGTIVSCFDILQANGGTPSVQSFANQQNCAATWGAYGSGGLSPDSAFDVTGWSSIAISDGLDDLKTMISAGVPLAYGTRLYTDFGPYRGRPSPYVGNGVIKINSKTGKPAGHVMVIIGYDDTQKAVLIQNSWGTGWGAQYNGSGGFVWMAYSTLLALAQGQAVYITQLGAQATKR